MTRTLDLGKLADLIAAERWTDALRLASRLKSLGKYTAVIRRGWEATVRPEFYRQIGQDPEQHIAAGIEALKARLGESPES